MAISNVIIADLPSAIDAEYLDPEITGRNTCSEQITKFRCIRRCYTSNARFEFLNIA